MEDVELLFDRCNIVRGTGSLPVLRRGDRERNVLNSLGCLCLLLFKIFRKPTAKTTKWPSSAPTASACWWRPRGTISASTIRPAENGQTPPCALQTSGRSTSGISTPAHFARRSRTINSLSTPTGGWRRRYLSIRTRRRRTRRCGGHKQSETRHHRTENDLHLAEKSQTLLFGLIAAGLDAGALRDSAISQA